MPCPGVSALLHPVVLLTRQGVMPDGNPAVRQTTEEEAAEPTHFPPQDRIQDLAISFPPDPGPVPGRSRRAFTAPGGFFLESVPFRAGPSTAVPAPQPTFAMATAVSDMRLETRHSLSYQVSTRTKLPSMTLVSLSAKIDEWLSWLKTLETRSSS